ncbi:MAG: hypothetical protein MJ214_04770 [Bacilli bacterium]|nr:hypothetical protein [Bacilli bacterium]
MAKKGQKFKKHSAEFKQKVLDAYFNGEGGRNTLSKRFNVSENTIETWLMKIRHGVDVRIDHRPNHSGKRKLSETDYKERYEILKKYQAFLKARQERK